MLYETLSDTLDAAQKYLDDERCTIVDSFRSHFNNGIKYGEWDSVHREILTLKGKKTQKWFHVVITRMDSGRYELVCYIS